MSLEQTLSDVRDVLEKRRNGVLSERERALLELRKASSIITTLENDAVDSVKKNLLSDAKGQILLASLLLDCDGISTKVEGL